MTGSHQVGEYLYDSDRGRLLQGDGEKRLEPQVNALLKLFIESPGETITREQISKHIWSDRVVGDDALRAMIRKLRDAFGDDARSANYIRTEPLKGYTLIAPVTPYSPDDGQHNSATFRHRKKLLLAIVGVTACAALIAGLLPFAVQEQAPATIDLLTRMTGSEVSPDYSPAGNRLIFSHRSNKDDFLQLYVKNLNTSQVQRLTWEPADYASALWSPDGQEIVYSRSVNNKLEHFLAKFDSQQGIVEEQPLLIDQITRRYLLAWSQDERAVYLKDGPRPGTPAGITKVNLDNGETTAITAPNVHGVGDIFARESFDGSMLAVLRDVEPGKQELLVLDKTTGGLLHTRVLMAPADRLVWSQSGDEITLSNFLGGIQFFDLNSNTLSVGKLPADGINDVFHKCGARCLYMRKHNGNFLDLLEQPNPFLKRPLMAAQNLDLPGAEDFPIFSRDQRGLYFIEKTGSALVLMYRGHHGKPVEIFHFPVNARVGALTLNSSGSHMAGLSDDRVFVMSLQEPVIEFISSGAELVGFPFWLADGSGLQFSKKEKGSVKLYHYDLISKATSSLMPGYLANIALNDNRFLRIDGSNKVWLVKPGHDPSLLTELPSVSPNRWQIRNSWMYFTAHEGNMAVMQRINLDSGIKEQVPLAKNRFRLNFDLSEDGERALFVRSLLAESDLVKVSLQ
ncbi:winged helix-turn-helix domain-containing protein [Microbulbifer mangrovi]|uniref:winged helix-turn-helix domain-containing protein n=1 Tax=Microbulbifer mangrovi TaxID=927787 RepID=UPI001300F9A4|nr:winged helix-turn-helix domain-containing protein [Microbulbifer mangrovi]